MGPLQKSSLPQHTAFPRDTHTEPLSPAGDRAGQPVRVRQGPICFRGPGNSAPGSHELRGFWERVRPLSHGEDAGRARPGLNPAPFLSQRAGRGRHHRRDAYLARPRLPACAQQSPTLPSKPRNSLAVRLELRGPRTRQDSVAPRASLGAAGPIVVPPRRMRSAARPGPVPWVPRLGPDPRVLTWARRIAPPRPHRIGVVVVVARTWRYITGPRRVAQPRSLRRGPTPRRLPIPYPWTEGPERPDQTETLAMVGCPPAVNFK